MNARIRVFTTVRQIIPSALTSKVPTHVDAQKDIRNLAAVSSDIKTSNA